MTVARPTSSLRWIAVACFVGSLAGCAEPDDTAVGGRLPECERLVAHLRTLPPGKYPIRELKLPQGVRPKGLLQVYVDARDAYSMEFSSGMTVDLNPAYVFVGGDPPESEAIAREVCSRSALAYRKPVREKGWHYATGQ